MEEIYWITRLDYISSTIVTITIISGIVCAIMTAIWLICNSLAGDGVCEDFNQSWAKVGKSFVRVCLPLFLVCLVGNTFVPTTKEAYIIYGVGGVIDFVRSDETTKQLPHKAVIAVDKYLESLSSEEDKVPTEKKRKVDDE